MKLTVERVKGGELATYSCSKCGAHLYEVLLPDGETVGPIYWDEIINRRCVCGEVLLIETTVPVVIPMITETVCINEMCDEVLDGVDEG